MRFEPSLTQTWALHLLLLVTLVSKSTGNRPLSGETPGGAGPSHLPNPSALNADGEYETHYTIMGHNYQFGQMSGATSDESALLEKQVPDRAKQHGYENAPEDLMPSANAIRPDRRHITSDMMNHLTDQPYQFNGTLPRNKTILRCQRDGVIGPEEQCDPGTEIANSGCDEHCRIVFGWSCDGNVGERSICDKVSETACYTAIFPRCGPQGGGASGTTLTVIGENFKPTAEYRARFALKSRAAMRNYTTGRLDEQWSPLGNSTQSEGDSIKFTAGMWMSNTELRFIIPVFSNVSYDEVFRTAVVALIVKKGTHTMQTGRANPTNLALNTTEMGVMTQCRQREAAKSVGHPGFMSSVLWRFTLTSRPVLFATNFLRDNVVELDTASGVVTDLFDPQSGGLRSPYGLDIGPDGLLYVASAGTKQILRYHTETGQFVGVFVDVKGLPRGIRWKEDYLYVLDATEKRVLVYYWHSKKVNPRQSEFPVQGEFVGVLTDGTYGEQSYGLGSAPGPGTGTHPYGNRASLHAAPDMQTHLGNGIRHSKRGLAGHGGEHREFQHKRMAPGTIDQPWDLRFHGWNGGVRLYVSSMGTKSVHQFNGITGAYEGKFTTVPLNMATGFDFSFQTNNPDLYATGSYAGKLWARYNSTNGKFKTLTKDLGLRMPTALLIHGDFLYVGTNDELRQYDLRTGKLLQVAAKAQGLKINFIIMAHRCN